MTQAEINCRGGPELQDLLKMSLVSAESPHMHVMVVLQVNQWLTAVEVDLVYKVILISMCKERELSLVLAETL